MIFKTTNSSVDKTRKTLALFNKDWNTYKRNWQNANGIFGKIGSIFSSSKGSSNNVVSKDQIQILRNWNNAVKYGCTNQETFNRIIGNADENTKMYFAGLNKRKGFIDGLKNAQNAAETSTIGLTIAQTALNAVIDMGIGLLVSLVVKGIDKIIHANEEAIEQAEELRKNYEEFKSTNESNVTTLKGLEKEFKELSKGVSQYGDNVSLTTEQYERYKEIIQQIVGMSPSLTEGYSTENGYIANKNGLLERAIKLQEQEYYNELREITNLDSLKTSMSGYIAEYKEAFNGGLVTDDMSATVTREFTDLQNAIYDIFNTNNRDDFSSEDMIKQIMGSIGIKDVEQEMAKYFNEYGYFQDQNFWNEYADVIAENIQVIINSLNANAVGLDDTVFDQNIEKVDSAAQSYLDMKNAISMANESIQKDLGYIAECADGYSDLSTEQLKFVNEFLKGFNISDIMSESNNPFDQGWKFDEDKMASIKSQITKFVEVLSQDETTKTALADLYAIPTDEQSISEYVEQFRNALEIIKTFCKENGIEIPIAISDSEQIVNDLEAQYQLAVNFAKAKFDGYDPTAFFNENSINTQEEVDKWLEIAQAAYTATDAEEKYLQSSTSNETDIPFDLTSFTSTINQIESGYQSLLNAKQEYEDNGGFLSPSTLSSLMESGLIQYLEQTEEGVRFNTDAYLSNSEAVKQNAILQLYNAMCHDVEAIAIGNTTELSAIAQTAIANAGVSAADAGNNASIGALGWYEYGASLDYVKSALSGEVQGATGTTKDQIDATIKSYQNIARMVSGINIGKTINTAKSSKTSEIEKTDYKKLLDDELNLLEKQLGAELISFTSYIDKRKDMIQDYYDNGKISASEYYDYLDKHYENELSYMDMASNAVKRVIDNRIEAYNDEIKALEEAHDNKAALIDSEIQKLEDQKDALQSENDAIERQLSLEQSLYDLERAQTQRTKKVYTGDRGFIYTQDQDAIKDAQESVRQSKLDVQISEIDSSIEKLQEEQATLEEKLNSEREAIERNIEDLEEYQSRWNDITSTYTKDQENMVAAALWGKDWENTILTDRQTALSEFTNTYITLQRQQAEAALAAAQTIGNAEKIKSGGNGSVFGDESLEKPYEKEASSAINAIPAFQATVMEPIILRFLKETLTQYGSGRISLKDTLSQKAVRDALKRFQKANGLKETGEYDKATQNKLNDIKNYQSNSYQSEDQLIDMYGVYLKNKIIPAYSKGGKNLKEQLAWTNENKEEAILSPARNAILTPLKQGDSVLTSKMTENLWEWAKTNPVQFNIPRPDYSHLSNLSQTNIQPVTVNIGDIHLHEVQNVNDFGAALRRELPGIVMQTLHRR